MEKLKPKFFTTIRDYSKEQFIKDVISGIIVAKSGMDGLIVATIMAGISCGNDLHRHISHLAKTGKNQCDTGITYCSDCIDCAGQGIIYAGQYHWRSV